MATFKVRATKGGKTREFKVTAKNVRTAHAIAKKKAGESGHSVKSVGFYTKESILARLRAMSEGGAGSGNFGHGGRAGEIGGSGETGSKISASPADSLKTPKSRTQTVVNIGFHDADTESLASAFGDVAKAYGFEVRFRTYGSGVVDTTVSLGDQKWKMHSLDSEDIVSGFEKIFKSNGLEIKDYSKGDNLHWEVVPIGKRKRENIITRLRKVYEGGSGSGNFGHSGRAGEIGGSGEGGGAADHDKELFATGKDINGNPVGKGKSTGFKIPAPPAGAVGEHPAEGVSAAKLMTYLQNSKNDLYPDAISKSKDSVYTFMKGFFYPRPGESGESYAAKVQSALPMAKILDSGRFNAPFKGGASVKTQSHFYVTFRLPPKSDVPAGTKESILARMRAMREGGAGSGNFGHSGIPGHTGGSGSGGGSAGRRQAREDAINKEKSAEMKATVKSHERSSQARTNASNRAAMKAGWDPNKPYDVSYLDKQLVKAYRLRDLQRTYGRDVTKIDRKGNPVFGKK